MRQGASLNISFDPQLVKSPNLAIDRCEQEEWFSGTFWRVWRIGTRFQVLFDLAFCSNYSIANHAKIPMFHFFFFFWKGKQGTTKNGECELLKMAKSCFIVILIKSWKSLELVSSLQYWAKNMLEMFVIKQTSSWSNFILIVLSVQKNKHKCNFC